MNIHIHAVMFPPITKRYVGAKNEVVFEKRYSRPLDPELFDAILNIGWVKLGIDEDPAKDTSGQVIKYDKETNTLTLRADMKLGTQVYMDRLRVLDWTLDKKAAELYGLPITDEAQLAWDTQGTKA